MGIAQVHDQMNLIYDDWKEVWTLELVHDVFTVNTQEAFNENKLESGFEEMEVLTTSYLDDESYEYDDSFKISTVWSSVSRASYSTE